MITPNGKLTKALEGNAQLQAEYNEANDDVRKMMNLYANLDAEGKKAAQRHIEAELKRRQLEI